jgi:hypothetical protein
MVLEVGCATRGNVYSDYREITREAVSPPQGKPTVVLILVDGLSVPALQRRMREGRTPRLREYFLGNRDSFQIGRAVFPSLTYPNISSILTARGIDQQPIIGNRMLLHGERENFESPLKIGLLNHELAPLSVFTQLKNRGETSASLAQYFGAGATVEFPRDVKSGLAYLNGDYSYIDGKALDSANRLLGDIDSSRWPSLVFVHLVGFDALAHQYGPESPQAMDYLSRLDERLEETFELLRGAQAGGKKAVTILTADHGFTLTPRFSDAERIIRRFAPEVTVVNQYRYLALHFPVGWTDERKARLLAEIRHLPGMELTMLRLRNDLWVQSATGAASDARIRYSRGGPGCRDGADYRLSLSVAGPDELCPEAYDLAARPYYFPYFVSSAAAYFHAPEHPDAVVLAGKGVAFTRGFLGQHGGMTPEELLVPVLMRGAALADPSRVIPTHKLLGFVTATPQAQGPAQLQEEQIVASAPSSTPSKRVPQELVLASPVTRWWLQTQSSLDSQGHTLSSDPTLGLSGEWHHYWNTILSTSAGYQFGFAQLHDSDDPALYRSGASLRQEGFVTGAYHFGPGEKLILRIGAQEQYFPHRNGVGAPQGLDKSWIPEVGFGSKNRVLSLGIGDLFVGGNLAFLVPRDVSGFSVFPGFKQVALAGFARPVGTMDTAAATVSLEHMTQNTSLEDRSSLAVGLSFSYGLTFAQ